MIRRSAPFTILTILTTFLTLAPAIEALAQQAPASPAFEGRPALLLPGSALFAFVEAGTDEDESGTGVAQDGPAVDRFASRRACDGCPPRSVGKALLHATIINGAYELANLARGQVTAEITPKTWWANMENGWVWDLDDFLVNQIGHPYQGSNYFTAGRSNGLSFYESAAVTAFGSGTWEYFGETNFPSLNDFINTTLGGIALGEMFHRAGWLVRDTHATGGRRLWSELGALILDPITGANRFITGDASRVADKPRDLVPSTLGSVTAAGVLWRGSQTNAVDAAGSPFLEMDLLYGDVRTGESRTPYDAFAVRLRFGGGAALSEAKVRGRLMGTRIGDSRMFFSALQSYDFQTNDAYSTGAQSFEGAFSVTHDLSTRYGVWFVGWGGITVLGAVDSLPLGVTEKPEEEEEHESDAGQGVSEGPRYYDYGPGGNFGATVAFLHDGRQFATASYEGRHIFSLDGVRANHFLQRTRVELVLPLRGSLGFGASGEYLVRDTYYKDAQATIQRYRYPQLRAYFTWRPL